MKRIFTSVAALLLTAITIQAQVSQNILPISQSAHSLESVVPAFETTETNHAVLLAEDDANIEVVAPFRFGIDKNVDIEFSNSGQWESLSNGDRVWRLNVVSEGAHSLNFTFDGFYMPEGASFHIHNENETLGAFTATNNQESGEFATYLIAGDHATLEYFEPLAVLHQGTLGLNKVIHGYKDILGTSSNKSAAGGGSGACNINVICPEGIGWEDETSGAVALILNGFVCSGSMITDVPQSGTPYLLTANHCTDGSGSPGTYVFRFNYEASTCAGNSGPTNQTVTGSVLRANNTASDMALLELNSEPPLSYGSFFTGWDRSGSVADETTCIHHPSGDIKKISHDFQSPQSQVWSGAQVWDVNWNEGVTEGGSSGSPLLDENHRIIGQLFGGSSSCTNPNGGDVYGKFDVSWDGASAASRLKDWLDPGNTGTTIMDGWDPNASAFSIDAGLPSIESVEDGGIVCGTSVDVDLLLVNSGNDNLTAATINWSIDLTAQTPYNWTGDLEYTDNEVVSIGNYPLSQGLHSMQFIITSANGGADENILNDTINVSFTVQAGNSVDLELRTDAQPTQTSWDLFDDMSNVVLSSDPYTAATTTHHQILCLPDGCYEFTIYDSGGNGICCNVGSGLYVLDAPSGEPMIGGGNFDSEETQGFCLPFVAPMPVADFSSNGNNVCLGESVIFSNESTPSVGTTRAWTFEGGSPSTSTSNAPFIGYNTVGDFDVTLVITNSTGSNTIVMQDFISVIEVTGGSSNIIDENLWDGGDNGSATVTGSGGVTPYTYAWSPGGASGSTVDNLSAGNYVVTVTDATGCENTVSVSIGNNVGINEADENAFMLFPNPTTGMVKLELSSDLEVLSVDILDMTGRLITTNPWNGAKIMTLNLSDLSQGAYNVSVVTPNRNINKRISILPH
ncbi:MAG: lysyl endopeptidase [Bacteroidia bacterium]|jgi:lysyl endopeptidase